MRYFLLAVFFVCFVATGLALATMLALPKIPDLFDGSPDDPVGIWQALTTIILAVVLVFCSVYAAGLLWLATACRMFKWEEVEQFIKAGPNTRLELWIVERFSR